jgi:hypothetical protein
MLETQAKILRKLAAEENQLKGLTEIGNCEMIDFNTRVKEVEEAITMLKL